MVQLYDQISRNKRKSYILIISAFILVLIVGYFFGYLTGLGDFGIMFAFILAILYNIIGYYYSDKIVMSISGAREVDKKEYPYLYNTIEGLSIAAGIPVPRMYVIEDDAPNAFATGRDPKHGAIAVTTGLLKIMNRQELEGVIAHEMSHINNYDIRFATLVVILVGVVSIMGNIALRTMFHSRGRREKGNGILLVIGLVLMILAPIFGELVRLAISRKREFLADASGALLTRYPEGLASALEKIGKTKKIVKNANETTAPLYIADPLPGKLLGLFSTHPPVEERVGILRSM